MNQIPFIPDNAPFSHEQRLWLNGYLAGMFSCTSAAAAIEGSATAALPTRKPIAILYGSQTGTAESLAKKTSLEAAKRGFEARFVDMAKHQTVDLAREENILVITSTYGDGEPPDNALGFWTFLSSEDVPPLDHLRYSVLALGDTNYPAFCEFGRKCDARLEELGAQRIHPRIDCDLEYDGPAGEWTQAVFAALTEAGSMAAAPETIAPVVEEAPLVYSRKIPYPARMLTNRLLTGAGSAKEVRHFEISLPDSELIYEVGDALGVVPSNCAAAVDELLSVLACDGEEAVAAPDGQETSLRLALTQHYDISRPPLELVKALAEHARDSELAALAAADRAADLKAYLMGREVIDLLIHHRAALTATVFVSLLKKLQPRLYSISSSPKAHSGEVHLTVGCVRYDSHGRGRKGVCSTFLADRCTDQTAVPIFVQTAHGFRPPSDPNCPMIMVGPGTGIAPFRAFLEERQATGATGHNWLFFGDQRRETDFLYQRELEAILGSGHLSRLDLAFSRDQAEKIYVQHRMLEAASDLWRSLQDGAHFYVCGDASRMAKDVDRALHEVCQTAGGLSPESAMEYVQQMKAEKRYQRDVY